jgi:signal peptidase I
MTPPGQRTKPKQKRHHLEAMSMYGSKAGWTTIMKLSKAVMRHLKSTARVALAGWLYVGLAVSVFAQTLVRVPSTSMAPTLSQGQLLEVDAGAYSRASPGRWEVVSFQLSPRSPILVYRVVGLPGEIVVYENKLLNVNGVAVTLTASEEKIATELGEKVFIESLEGERHLVQMREEAKPVMVEAIENFANRDSCSYSPDGFRCVVPANKYFVMGDNRDSSNDSRYRGFVPIERILGRVGKVWSPPEQRLAEKSPHF